MLASSQTWLLGLTFSLLFFVACQVGGSSHFANLRKQMVDTQIKARGIKDQRVLEAMMAVERHRFVPNAHKRSAYDDEPKPIGHNQTISQPYIVGLMTELLELTGGERVLEIGTGSGYQAAVLSRVVGDNGQVYSIEIVEALGELAAKRLSDLHYDNVHVKVGDGYAGWPDQGPFDAIVVTAAPKQVPAPLLEQLKEGGRLVIPVGGVFQELKLLTKTGGQISELSILPVRFVPMTGTAAG